MPPEVYNVLDHKQSHSPPRNLSLCEWIGLKGADGHRAAHADQLSGFAAPTVFIWLHGFNSNTNTTVSRLQSLPQNYPPAEPTAIARLPKNGNLDLVNLKHTTTGRVSQPSASHTQFHHAFRRTFGAFKHRKCADMYQLWKRSRSNALNHLLPRPCRFFLSPDSRSSPLPSRPAWPVSFPPCRARARRHRRQ